MKSVILSGGCWEHLHLLTKKILFHRLNQIVGMTSLIMLLCHPFVATVSSNSEALNLTLIYSGDEQGLLGAHGCSEQMGGLDRSHTLLKSLFAKRKTVLNLHVGNILDQLNSDSELIYQIALEALSVMNYDAVSLGPNDLCLPVESLKALHANHPEMPFVCANVENQNLLAFAPYVIAKVFPSMKVINIAVVSVIGKAHEIELKAYNPNLTVIEPGTALANLADELARESDFVVVSFHASKEEGRKLAKEFSWVDVLIVSQDEQAAELLSNSGTSATAPIVVGETIIVTGAPKGEAIGLLDIRFDPEMQIVSRQNQFIGVSEKIMPSEELVQLMALYENLVEEVDGLKSKANVPEDQAVNMTYFYKRGCDKCARDVCDLLGDANDGALILDESGIPKQGKMSVGVERQYCGRQKCRLCLHF